MKKRMIFVICLVLCLSGCVSQSEYDTVNSQIISFQEELSAKDDEISRLKSANDDYENKNKDLSDTIEQLNSDKGILEKQVADLNSKIDYLTSKIDELENGASQLLAKINNAFEQEDYDTVVKIATELHVKFNGSDEDVKGQELSQKAQKEIDRVAAEKKAEEERAAAEAAKSEKEKIQSIIRLGGAVVDKIDSAGGVSIYVYWRNESDKEIKYLRFYVTPYNAVGDRVNSEIGNKSTTQCYITGPLPKSSSKYKDRKDDNYFFFCSPNNSWELVLFYNGYYEYSYYTNPNDWSLNQYKTVQLTESQMVNAFQGSYFDCVWYNNTIKEIKINKVEIEYIDGTKETLDEKQVQLAMN